MIVRRPGKPVTPPPPPPVVPEPLTKLPSSLGGPVTLSADVAALVAWLTQGNNPGDVQRAALISAGLVVPIMVTDMADSGANCGYQYGATDAGASLCLQILKYLRPDLSFHEDKTFFYNHTFETVAPMLKSTPGPFLNPDLHIIDQAGCINPYLMLMELQGFAQGWGDFTGSVLTWVNAELG